MTEKKNTWGGSRGGGRPKNDRNIVLSVRISQEAMDKLNEVTNNKTEFIDNLIKKYTVMNNLFNEISTRHKSAYYNNTPLCQAMLLKDVFDYNLFEEVRFTPLFDFPKDFTIHKNDVEERGKFYEFRNFPLRKLGRLFDCDVALA